MILWSVVRGVCHGVFGWTTIEKFHTNRRCSAMAKTTCSFPASMATSKAFWLYPLYVTFCDSWDRKYVTTSGWPFLAAKCRAVSFKRKRILKQLNCPYVPSLLVSISHVCLDLLLKDTQSALNTKQKECSGFGIISPTDLSDVMKITYYVNSRRNVGYTAMCLVRASD